MRALVMCLLVACGGGGPPDLIGEWVLRTIEDGGAVEFYPVTIAKAMSGYCSRSTDEQTFYTFDIGGNQLQCAAEFGYDESLSLVFEQPLCLTPGCGMALRRGLSISLATSPPAGSVVLESTLEFVRVELHRR